MDPVKVRVTANGQISLPAEIRRRWGVDEVIISDEGDYVLLAPVVKDISELRGVWAGRFTQTTEEMRAESREEERAAEERRARAMGYEL